MTTNPFATDFIGKQASGAMSGYASSPSTTSVASGAPGADPYKGSAPSYASNPTSAPLAAGQDPFVTAGFQGTKDHLENSSFGTNLPASRHDTDATQGVNLQNPGYGEQYYANHTNDYAQPGYAQQYYQQNQGQYAQPAQAQQYWQQVQSQQAPQASNNMQQAYDRLNTPQNPGLDAYYQRQYDVGAGRINNQLAARGMFGSSQGLQQLGNFASGLGAEQANREAQYALDRNQQILGAAGQADQGSLARANQQLNWMQGMGGLAGQADQSALSRLLGGQQAAQSVDSGQLSRLAQGMNAANTAQGLRENRIGNQYDRVLGLGQATAPYVAGSYDSMMQQDQGLFNDQIAAELGIPREALNGALAQQNANRQAVGTIGQIVGSAMGMPGGGGGGGSTPQVTGNYGVASDGGQAVTPSYVQGYTPAGQQTGLG